MSLRRTPRVSATRHMAKYSTKARISSETAFCRSDCTFEGCNLMINGLDFLTVYPCQLLIWRYATSFLGRAPHSLNWGQSIAAKRWTSEVQCRGLVGGNRMFGNSLLHGSRERHESDNQRSHSNNFRQPNSRTCRNFSARNQPPTTIHRDSGFGRCRISGCYTSM